MMQVQVNTDNHIKGAEGLAQRVEETVRDALSRFGNRLTRVEVHFTDENSRRKDSGDDKRCVLEARLAGLQPNSVSADAATVDLALSGALDKLIKALTKTLGRREAPKGRPSFAGEDE